MGVLLVHRYGLACRVYDGGDGVGGGAAFPSGSSVSGGLEGEVPEILELVANFCQRVEVLFLQGSVCFHL